MLGAATVCAYDVLCQSKVEAPITFEVGNFSTVRGPFSLKKYFHSIGFENHELKKKLEFSNKVSITYKFSKSNSLEHLNLQF